MAAFSRANERRGQYGVVEGSSPNSCNGGPIYDQSVPGQDQVASSGGSDPYRLGVVQVWAKSPQTTGIPENLRDLFYRVPGRFLGDFCGIRRYDDIGSKFEYGAIDDGYGIEEDDNPPSYPPGDIPWEEYLSLNPGERKLLWQAFLRMNRSDFLDFVEYDAPDQGCGRDLGSFDGRSRC